MNKIIKKLRIPGHEVKEIFKPRKHMENKQPNGIQLSLDIASERNRPGIDK